MIALCHPSCDASRCWLDSEQVVLNLTLAQCSSDNLNVYYVLANHDGLHQIYEDSMALRFDKFNSDYSSFTVVNHTVAIVVLFAEILLVIVPIVMKVSGLGGNSKNRSTTLLNLSPVHSSHGVSSITLTGACLLFLSPIPSHCRLKARSSSCFTCS